MPDEDGVDLSRGRETGRMSPVTGKPVDPASTKLAQFLRSCSEAPINIREIMEARVGIEPTHKGFADLSLTTWVPRLEWAYFNPAEL